MIKIPDGLEKAYAEHHDFGKKFMEKLAEGLNSVQPIPNDSLKVLYENAKDRDELKKQGYKPVSSIGLMWIKEDK